MGTRITPKVEAHGFSIQIVRVGNGPITQVLHPDWVYRDNIQIMSNLLLEIDKQLTLQNCKSKLLLTGGGYIQINEFGYRSSIRKNKLQTLKHVYPIASEIAEKITEYTHRIERNIVLGLDIVINQQGVGQFGIAFENGETLGIAWKSYPVNDENKWLAGFGYREGREAPRYIDLDLGTSMILVCHDAQAFNHRNKALVARAHQRTQRMEAMEFMQREVMNKKPEWAFNLVHYIGKPGSVKPFSTSYKQLGSDYDYLIHSVGSFGYTKPMRPLLIDLASKMQYPRKNVGSLVIIGQGQ